MNAHVRNNLRVSVVYWLALGGIALWMLLAALHAVPNAPDVQVIPFLIVVVLATLNLLARSLERFFRDRKEDGYRRFLHSWFFVTTDLILVGFGLRFTGGLASPLWIILFLIGVAESLLASSFEAYLIRYGAILSLILGTIPFPLNGITSGYFIEMGVRIGCLAAVTSVARRLRVNSEKREMENASLRAELALAEERSRLSREVHDGVGNSLAATVLRLEFAARKAEKDGASETGRMFREEAQALREAMTTVRDWTFFTKPWANPENSRLAASVTLKQEVERLSRRTHLPMEVSGVELLDTMPPAMQLAVLRIVQEGLTNAAKHAQNANRAMVTIARDRNIVVLTIADDGSGFDTTGTGSGVGMSSMRERAESLGGSFSVQSATGTGTTLTARLPVS